VEDRLKYFKGGYLGKEIEGQSRKIVFGIYMAGTMRN
jgi:hypothetical protein